MSTGEANTNPIQEALHLAGRGAKVLLTCWPDESGQCACPGQWDANLKRLVPHQGAAVGKAPFAKGGYTAATGDPEEIKRLWTRYPDANVGIWLEGSGWAAIDADSDLAAAEAHKLGMLPRPIRHSRHQAYLFKLPAGAPIERVIHAGADRKLDILSEGHLVAYGKHKDGHRVWIDWNGITELNPLEDWAVKLLVARDAERNASKGPVGEPGLPTTLSEREVIERAKASPTRGVLFSALYESGAPHLIGACPCEPTCATTCPHTPTCTEHRCPAKCMAIPYASESERDLALMNFIRFWGGADPERMKLLFDFSAPGKRPKWQGSASYRAATIAKALPGKVWHPARETSESQILEALPNIGKVTETPLQRIEQSGSDGSDIVCMPRAEYDRLIARDQRLSQVERIIANGNMAPGPKLIGVTAIVELERREDWRPSKVEAAVGLPDGFRCVSRERLAAAAGVSQGSVKRHLATLEELGILESKTAGLPRGRPDVLSDKGEIIDRPQRFTGIRLVQPANVALDQLAQARVEPKPVRKPEPGICSEHPRAGTYLRARKSLHCEACNAQLAQSAQIALTDESLPISTIPNPTVAIGMAQIAPTRAISRRQRQENLLARDIRRDDETARAINDFYERHYAVQGERVASNRPPLDPLDNHLDWFSKARSDRERDAWLDQMARNQYAEAGA